jgi:hypothetical protein
MPGQTLEADPPDAFLSEATVAPRSRPPGVIDAWFHAELPRAPRANLNRGLAPFARRSALVRPTSGEVTPTDPTDGPDRSSRLRTGSAATPSPRLNPERSPTSTPTLDRYPRRGAHRAAPHRAPPHRDDYAKTRPHA